VWIGCRAVLLRGNDVDGDARPVRIRQGALGANAPRHDVIVSANHGIALTCVDDVLVSAGDLVNGSSIAWADDLRRITYWHVELDRHDLIDVAGLRAESYLDVGNRLSFGISGTGNVERPVGQSPAPCLQHTGEGPVLNGIRSRLAARAEAMGWRITSIDPEVHLIVDGMHVAPARSCRGFVFRVPPGATSITLCSATLVPRELDVNTEDRRSLGLLVSGIEIDNEDGSLSLDMLSDSIGTGFHSPESHRRWTNGSAEIEAVNWRRFTPKGFSLEVLVDMMADRSWVIGTPERSSFHVRHQGG